MYFVQLRIAPQNPKTPQAYKFKLQNGSKVRLLLRSTLQPQQRPHPVGFDSLLRDSKFWITTGLYPQELLIDLGSARPVQSVNFMTTNGKLPIDFAQ